MNWHHFLPSSSSLKPCSAQSHHARFPNPHVLLLRQVYLLQWPCSWYDCCTCHGQKAAPLKLAAVLRQIWSNCHTYNAPGSQIAMAGSTTQAALTEEWLARHLAIGLPSAEPAHVPAAVSDLAGLPEAPPEPTQDMPVPLKLKIKVKKRAEAAAETAAASQALKVEAQATAEASKGDRRRIKAEQLPDAVVLLEGDAAGRKAKAKRKRLAEAGEPSGGGSGLLSAGARTF